MHFPAYLICSDRDSNPGLVHNLIQPLAQCCLFILVHHYPLSLLLRLELKV
jgi:hypothetical protein